MIKFLLDANLSPETAAFLNKLGFNTKSITKEKLGYLDDEEIVEIAKKEDRIIVTFDLDFGEIYHEREIGKVGVIVLRLDNQTVENVNLVLRKFIDEYKRKINDGSSQLIVVKKNSIRFIK